MKFLILLASALLLMIISGCNVSERMDHKSTNSAPSGIEGRWSDANGMVTSFHNGSFETRTPDTNEKLSEGNYNLSSPQSVELDMRSLVRGTVSRVNCAMANKLTQLSCVSPDGKQFTLTRQH